MMTPTTIRRLLQLVAVMVAEVVFFAVVPTPWPIRTLVAIACGCALVRHWRRQDSPEPRHRRPRRRVGPPMEWID